MRIWQPNRNEEKCFSRDYKVYIGTIHVLVTSGLQTHDAEDVASVWIAVDGTDQ